MNTELMANSTYVEYTENFRVTKRLSSNSFFFIISSNATSFSRPSCFGSLFSSSIILRSFFRKGRFMNRRSSF